MDTISSMLQQAMEGQKQLNINKPTTTKQMTQLVTNVKPRPTPKSQPVDIEQPLDKMPPSPYAAPIKTNKPLTMQQIKNIPVTKLMNMAPITQDVRHIPKALQDIQSFDDKYDIWKIAREDPRLHFLQQRYNVPLVGGTIAITDLLPSNALEAGLFYEMPAIGKIGEGFTGLIKSAVWNATKFGIWNEAINETHNLTTGRKFGTGAPMALETGAGFGGAGTAFVRAYPFVSKFIRAGVGGLAKTIFEAFPETTQKSLQYAAAQAAKNFNPVYALVEKPTLFFLKAVNMVGGTHHQAQIASSNAVNFIDSKEMSPFLDEFAKKISSDLNLNLNRYQAAAYILRLPDNELKELVEANPEFKDLIKVTKDKLVEYKTNVAGAKEAFERNREALRIKRTLQGKPATEMEWKDYLTTAKGPHFALLEKDTPVLKEIADNYKDAKEFWKAYYGSISYPVILDQFFRIGRGLSSKLNGKYVYTINKYDARRLAQTIAQNLKSYFPDEALDDVKEKIYQKLQTMPVAGSYSDIYKEIYDMIEQVSGKLPDYENIRKGFEGQYKDGLTKNINDFKGKIKDIRESYEQQLKDINKQLRQEYNAKREYTGKNFSQDIKDFRTQYKQNYTTGINDINERINNIKTEYTQQLKDLKAKSDEILQQAKQTKNKDLYVKVRDLEANLKQKYKDEADAKIKSLLDEKQRLRKDYQKSLQEEINNIREKHTTTNQQHQEDLRRQKEEINKKMEDEKQAKKDELLNKIKLLREEYRNNLGTVLNEASNIKKEQITKMQKILHQLYDVPNIREMTTQQEADTLKGLFEKADKIFQQEGADKLSVAKKMQFYQDIAMAFHNFGESDIVENKLVPGLPINEVINDIHNLADKIQNIRPQSYYYLRDGFNGSIVNTIKEYLMPSEFYKNNEFGTGTLQNNFFITLKRLAIGLVPFYHMKSLTASTIYSDANLSKGFEGAKNLLMDKKEFADKMSPMLKKMSELFREFPKTSTVLSGTTSSPFREGSLIDKIPYVRYMDDRLWNRMYNYYKVSSFAKIYDDLMAGKLTRDEAERMIKNVNTFFGGAPELANLNPKVRSALRWLFFAPDWEWTLIKQVAGGALGLDEDRVRYVHNFLIFNMYLNSLISASRGLQPDTTDWHRVYSAIKDNDIGRLFEQTITVAGVPINIDLLGYEREMPTLFYSAFEPLLQAGGITRGSLKTAIGNLAYHISTKLNPGIQEISSIYQWMNSPQKREEESVLQAVLKPFFPYFAKGLFFPQNWSNWKASLAASGLSNLGIGVYQETKSDPLVDIMTSRKQYTPETYQAMGKYVNAYIQQLAKSKKDPNMSFEYNFYSTLLDRKFSDVIPNYNSLVSQIQTEINNKDQKGVEATAKQFKSYTQRTAQQIYDTIHHSTFFDILQKKVGVEKAKQLTASLAMGILKYAFMRSEQQATKNQTTSINPNETQPQQNQPQNYSNLTPLDLSNQTQPQAQPQSYSISPTKINNIVQQASTAYGVPAKLIKAVIKAESTNDPNAVSNKGAIGLMQLEPQTAQQLGVTNPYDPQQNIMAGTKYLSELIKKYNGNYTLALAAYNAGPNAVDQYGGVPPFEETINYINEVAKYYN